MRILTCASYHGTGSSAITDLLSEYSCYKSLLNYEFRFVQDPEGISDLEYNLVENHHRLNSGHALKRYKQYVDMLAGNKIIKWYERFFNNNWKKCSYKYINELMDFSYKGYWHQDVIDKGKSFYGLNMVVGRILVTKNEITMCSAPSEEKFLICTRNYIDELFRYANDENKSAIVVDQLVPPSNLSRYLRYFNDIKVFVVDRDPRDIYLSEKYVWKGRVIPVENVKLFCKWFKYTRHHRKKESFPIDNVMYIQFEDLIYKYEDTLDKIEKWLNLDSNNHSEQFKYLNPKVSIKNTRLWEKYTNCNEDIRYIEKELYEYIYDYYKLQD